jgi:mono/diheme cytochrome c family protein
LEPRVLIRLKVFLSLFVIGLLTLCLFPKVPTAAQQVEPAPKPVDFDREIRPILSDNCFACHGPDEGQRQVGLRLDTKEGAFADRGGYQVIVPGKASESRLFQRVSAKDEALRMPPPGFERNLTAKQIELIRRWIDQGAKWETHWSFVPPKRPPLPMVKEESWPRNGIDRFILAHLEREGLRPTSLLMPIRRGLTSC